MPRFMIEVKHGDDEVTCVRALRVIEQYGSHLMTHAEWGCKDGYHACWLIGDLGSREEALHIVPPEFRPDARVIELNRFSRQEIADLVAQYGK